MALDATQAEDLKVLISHFSVPEGIQAMLQLAALSQEVSKPDASDEGQRASGTDTKIQTTCL